MSAKPKARKPGRPPLAGERGILLAGRVAPAIAKEVDVYAKRDGLTRSEAVRQLIERGLKTTRKAGE